MNGLKFQSHVLPGLIQIPESELKEVETSMEQVKQRLSEKKKGFFLAIQASGNNFWIG